MLSYLNYGDGRRQIIYLLEDKPAWDRYRVTRVLSVTIRRRFSIDLPLDDLIFSEATPFARCRDILSL